MELHGPPYLIDGHVHLHPCFDEERFFRAAADNFAEAGRALHLPGSPSGILMLAESSGIDRFADLQRRASKGAEDHLAPTGEEQSVQVALPGRSPILVVAGRQLVTAENLEILALGCPEELTDGQSFEATLNHVREAKAIPVIPWGFGKWHAGRRQVLLEVLNKQSHAVLFLGDNGGRASLLSPSSLFRIGVEKGIHNLPGSDPLPFAREEQRAGSFGFVLDESLNPESPATDLLRQLAESAKPLQPFGDGLGTRSFLLNQIGMQLRKRLMGRRR